MNIAQLLREGGAAEVWLDGGTTMFVRAVSPTRVEHGSFPLRGPAYTGDGLPYVPESALWWRTSDLLAKAKIMAARSDESAFIASLSRKR